MSSFSGANPSSWMSSAYPFWERRTPSMLRNTMVSFSEPTAAFATTKATVALSGLSLAQVRLTQNRPAISTLLSGDPVDRVLRSRESVPGHPAPGGDVLPGARIEGAKPEDLPRPERRHAVTQLEDQVPAAHVARVPFRRCHRVRSFPGDGRLAGRLARGSGLPAGASGRCGGIAQEA